MPYERIADMDDLPLREWECDVCGYLNSSLDGECQNPDHNFNMKWTRGKTVHRLYKGKTLHGYDIVTLEFTDGEIIYFEEGGQAGYINIRMGHNDS